jgi:hypothetical protein
MAEHAKSRAAPGRPVPLTSPAVLTVSSQTPLADLERQVRARAARDGLVNVFADPGGYRQLRRLAARLEANPVPGGDSMLIGPEGGPEPGPHRSATVTDDEGGGVLIVSARPFPVTG